MSKKSMAGLILLVVTLSLLAGLYLLKGKQPGEYTGPVEKIVLASYEGDSGLIPYIAEEQDYFREQGVDVQFKNYEAGKLAVDALLAGKADIATSAEAVLVSHSFQNQDLRLLSTIAVGNTNGVVARKDRGIKTAKDLRGKRVGVTGKSAGEYNLGVLLMFNGLQMEDIEPVDLKPGEIVRSVVSGETDAGFTWEPNLYHIKTKLDENAIIIKTEVPEVRFVLLSTNKWLKNNPDAALRFMKALLKAERYIRQNPEKAKLFTKEKFGYEQDYLVSTWQNHRFVIELPQPLLNILEGQAKWQIRNNRLDTDQMPNYLEYIYFDALNALKPEAVTIIRRKNEN